MASTTKPDTSPLIDLMFQAFCHRLRLRILHLLHEGEMCVGNIAEVLQAPQPKVSRHLAVLKKAKLRHDPPPGTVDSLRPGSRTQHIPSKASGVRGELLPRGHRDTGGQGTDRSHEIARQWLLLAATERVDETVA